MTREPQPFPQRINFTLDDRPLSAEPGETLLQAAKRAGIDIPHLCYKEGLRPDGNCRACVVEIEGERALAASCSRTPSEGMVAKSQDGRPRKAQRLVLELLQSDMAETRHTHRNELDHWWQKNGVGQAPFPCPQTTGCGPLTSRHYGEPGCLHPMHPVSARLSRRAGQQCDRLCPSRRRLDYCIRRRR